MKQTRREASVQRGLLAIRETSEDMLCLYAPGSPSRRSYRAVLEVSPINLALKAEDEQEAILARFAALIRSLSFPVQVLVRNQRLDLSSYIQRLLARPEGEHERQHSPSWYALAESVAQLVQRIAAERTLIKRHMYLIIPASQQIGSSRRRGGGGMAAIFGTRRGQRVAETREQARQELALRTEALAQQLASCGLTCERLSDNDLVHLYASCLTPERAIAHPLSDTLLAAVGRATHVKRRKRKTSHEQGVQPVGREHNPTAALPMKVETEPMLAPPDLLQLVDLLAPECIEVTPDALRVGQEYVCGVAVTACPREVSFDGWLAPLVLHDEVCELSFHYHPQDSATMKRQLARHRAGHTSSRQFNRRAHARQCSECPGPFPAVEPGHHEYSRSLLVRARNYRAFGAETRSLLGSAATALTTRE